MPKKVEAIVSEILGSDPAVTHSYSALLERHSNARHLPLLAAMARLCVDAKIDAMNPVGDLRRAVTKALVPDGVNGGVKGRPDYKIDEILAGDTVDARLLVDRLAQRYKLDSGDLCRAVNRRRSFHAEPPEANPVRGPMRHPPLRSARESRNDG